MRGRFRVLLGDAGLEGTGRLATGFGLFQTGGPASAQRTVVILLSVRSPAILSLKGHARWCANARTIVASSCQNKARLARLIPRAVSSAHSLQRLRPPAPIFCAPATPLTSTAHLVAAFLDCILRLRPHAPHLQSCARRHLHRPALADTETHRRNDQSESSTSLTSHAHTRLQEETLDAHHHSRISQVSNRAVVPVRHR